MPQQTLLNHDNIKAFKQHGFRPTGTSGNQVYGNCIFCGKDSHFYINPEVKKWDCKICGKSGGYKKFIIQLVSFCEENFTVDRAITLAKLRGLKAKTLLNNHIGYNPWIESFIVPCYEINNQDIYGVKIFPFRNKSFSKTRPITAGGKAGYLGWQALTDMSIVEWWIVEGEWDYFTWIEILNLKKLNHGVLCLPSGTSFKDDLIQYFKHRIVHVVLDNDSDIQVKGKTVFGAGVQGMIKIYNKLSSIVKEINFIHWPNNLKDGYDINDCYRDNKSDFNITFEQIKGFLNQYPPKASTDEIRIPTHDTSPSPVMQTTAGRYLGNGISCQEVYTVFNSWLKLKSNDMIDATLGAIIGNRFPGDPIWLYLIGPSGCAKSVMLMALDCHFDIEVADSLTPATLISGSKSDSGGDPSLLPKINKRILVMKDGTALYEMQPAFRNEIFAILRPAFDGHYAKHFGNGTRVRTGKSKFGFLMGMTEVLEQYNESESALGTRFLQFHVPVGDIHSILKQIDRNIEDEFENNSSMRDELKSVVREVLDFNYDLKSISIPDNILESLRYQSIVIEIMRGTVPTDKFTKEITFKAVKALPTRSYVQLRKLLAGIMLFKGIKTPDSDCLRIIKDISIGTIPLSRSHILSLFYRRKNEHIDLTYIKESLRLPATTCQRSLEKLIALDALEKIRGSTTFKSFYKLTDPMIEAIERGGLYE